MSEQITVTLTRKQFEALRWAGEFASVNLSAVDEAEWGVTADEINNAVIALTEDLGRGAVAVAAEHYGLGMDNLLDGDR